MANKLKAFIRAHWYTKLLAAIILAAVGAVTLWWSANASAEMYNIPRSYAFLLTFGFFLVGWFITRTACQRS